MQPNFSKRLGCAHAAIVIVGFIIAAGAAAIVYQRSPEVAGEIAGRCVFVVGPLGFLASYFYQKGRKLPAGVLVAGVWSALPILFFVAAHHWDVTDLEKRDLEVSSTRIRHPDFAFSFPNPGAAFRLVELPPEMSLVFERQPGGRQAFAWLMRKRDSTEALALLVLKFGTVVDEDGLRQFAQGMRRRATSATGIQLLEDTIDWQPRLHEYRLVAHSSTGTYGKARCLAALATPAVIVCVQTWSGDPNGLDFVRAGLVLEPPPFR